MDWCRQYVNDSPVVPMVVDEEEASGSDDEDDDENKGSDERNDVIAEWDQEFFNVELGLFSSEPVFCHQMRPYCPSL